MDGLDVELNKINIITTIITVAGKRRYIIFVLFFSAVETMREVDEK